MFVTSCVPGDYGIKPADPQRYDQEDAIEYPVIAAAAAEAVVNYQTMAEGTEKVKVADFTALEAPEEGKLADTYKLFVSNKYFIDIDAEGMVGVDTLASVVKMIYGPSPKERTLDAKVTVDYVVDGQATLIQSENIGVKVALPLPMHVSEAYWLIGNVKDANPWSKEGCLPFERVEKEDGEPVFQIKIETTGEEKYWKIVPKENYESNIWAEGPEGILGVAVDGDASFKGNLVTASPQAAKIQKAGKYVLTINLWECTYELRYDYPEYVYVPGDANGWKPASAPAIWSQNVDGKFKGFACVNQNGFKFTNARNWDEGDFGTDAFSSMSDGFGGSGNINAPKAAYYYLEVDLISGILKAVEIISFGVIGDATPGGWDADTDMTWDAEGKCWKATVTLTDGTFKFRANDGWDINLGGAVDNLDFGAADIPVTEGTYEIKLYAERTDSQNMYCTMTAVAE